MSTTEKTGTNVANKPKKRIVPNPKKGQTFEQALEETHKQYAGTLAKLAK